MKLLLKKYFVPHAGNDHKPHLLRPKALGAIALGVIALEGLFLLQQAGQLPAQGYLAEIFSTVLVDQTNEQREENDLGTLRTSAILTRAAQMKADDMAEKGYFAHDTPDGKDSWYWFKQAGYAYSYAGENLAVNFSDSSDVTRAWMRSPDHRANIVNGNFREVGIATAEGTYKGKRSTFVVQLFGTPASIAAQAQLQAAEATLTPTTTTSTPQVAAAASGPAVLPTPPAQQQASQEAARPAAEEPRDNFTVATTSTGTVPAAVAGEEDRSEVSPVAAAAASPRAAVEDVYLALAALIAIAILLTIAHASARNPRMIAHGMAVVVLIGVALAVNGYVSLRGAEIIGAHAAARE